MAEKRMFSNKITQSDPFLSMPATSQNLYWHLSMDADDDGFVNRPKSIMRMVNASDDDMNILITRKFIIPFSVEDNDSVLSMVCVIKHWFIHNNIRNDRKKPTNYVKQKDLLMLSKNGAYSLKNEVVQPIVNQVTTNGMHSVLENSVLEGSVDNTLAPGIFMPIANGTDYLVTNSMIQEYRNVYEKINVDFEISKMRLWLVSNPKKQKTKNGMPKFINSWLSRTSEKYQSTPTNPLVRSVEMPVYSTDTKISGDIEEIDRAIEAMLGGNDESNTNE